MVKLNSDHASLCYVDGFDAHQYLSVYLPSVLPPSIPFPAKTVLPVADGGAARKVVTKQVQITEMDE